MANGGQGGPSRPSPVPPYQGAATNWGVGTAVPDQPRPWNRWVSAVWASVPFVTMGLGAAPAFVVAAARRRSWLLGGVAAAYGAATAVALVLTNTNGPRQNTGAVILVVLWLAATTHAVVIRPAVARGVVRTAAAITEARSRIHRRDEARRMLREDPRLAGELRIGRPDLAPSYDDGGLIDVNHVPAWVLVQLAGLDPQVADAIVARRAEVGEFSSADDAIEAVDLAPDVFDHVKDRLLFLE